ncbi:MAG TPA: hypothetical protein V6C97_19465 [Oculatellaceae cyanobacterium]
MVATDSRIESRSGTRSTVSIPTESDALPIEVTVVAKLPPGTGRTLVGSGLNQQMKHAEYLDEYNEPSALIGKTNFQKEDPTGIYTFGVDRRDLVFHRHAGHRVITGISGAKGCVLKFSLSGPEEAESTPEKFLEKLYIVRIAADRIFVLRFSGTVYHQFCPADVSEDGFFAVSVHTNEAGGLSGDLLQQVLANKGNIPLLTEPAPPAVMKLLAQPDALRHAVEISLDLD